MFVSGSWQHAWRSGIDVRSPQSLICHEEENHKNHHNPIVYCYEWRQLNRVSIAVSLAQTVRQPDLPRGDDKGGNGVPSYSPVR